MPNPRKRLGRHQSLGLVELALAGGAGAQDREQG